MSDRRRKGFELVLTKEALLSDSQLAWQRGLGVGLMDEEARAFALACREPDIGLWQIKAVTGLSGPESTALAERLVNRALFEPAGANRYALAEHLRRRWPRSDQVSDQACAWPDADGDHVRPQRPDMIADYAAPPRMTAHQRRIVDSCDVPRSLLDLMERAGVTHRTFFRRRHVQPLIDAGIIRMTSPDHRNAADQRYVLTETGVALKAARMGAMTGSPP